jgi:hypothetical protein
VLQQPEQHTASDPRQIALALAVLRELVQYDSSDKIMLAIWGAAGQLGIERKEAEKMMSKVLFHASSAWPKGFI